MEDGKGFGGIDSSDHSTTTSQYDRSASSDDLEDQPRLISNNALDTMTHEKAPRDPNFVDWDGPDDPENPLNWSSAKKLAAIGIVSLITMLS